LEFPTCSTDSIFDGMNRSSRIINRHPKRSADNFAKQNSAEGTVQKHDKAQKGGTRTPSAFKRARQPRNNSNIKGFQNICSRGPRPRPAIMDRGYKMILQACAACPP
jgi:hypothetical protein